METSKSCWRSKLPKATRTRAGPGSAGTIALVSAQSYNAGMKKLILGFAAGTLLGMTCGSVFLGDLVDVAFAQGGDAGATGVKILLENARVRVREVTFPPKQTSPMHTHTLAHVGVVIQGGTLTFRYPDGKTETEKLAAGGVGYRDANVTHEPTNVGTTPVRVIEVELK